MNNNSIYIHIPFCEHICEYCDFTKLLYNEEFVSSYMEALFFEIDSYKLTKTKTIYVGGGTPTSISDELFEKLLKKISQYLDSIYEFTVEANVENLTKEKLLIMKKYGVNRLSIGIESTDDEILKTINRHHTFEEAKEKVILAKSLGFNNINVDLIYGLPGQDKKILIKDLNNLISLNTEHISIYSLSVSKGSNFYNKGIRPLDDEKDAEYFDLIVKILKDNGYNHYEVSNFAKPGYESRHNKVYWKALNYYGIGLGASGYIDNIRYKNTSSLKQYLSHNFIKEKEELSETDEINEYFMLNLRLLEGFEVGDFISRFNFDPRDRYKEQFTKLEKDGLLEIGDRIIPTEKGIKLLDIILRLLFI